MGSAYELDVALGFTLEVYGSVAEQIGKDDIGRAFLDGIQTAGEVCGPGWRAVPRAVVYVGTTRRGDE